MKYRVRRISELDSLNDFDCGKPELNTWLKSHSRNAQGQGTRTYVMVRAGSRQVIGYFAIAPHLVKRSGLPTRVSRGAPRQIPAILLAKLALDQSVQGTGMGSILLIEAIRVVLGVAKGVGGKLLVVDAFDDEAAAFYRRHDFHEVSDRRLVMKLSTAAKALGSSWP